ncbi:MAG: DUF4111 domain-containing protein [Clostridium sp.]
MKSVKYLLEKIVNAYKSILQENLIGIYLHGSLVMNDFNEQSSDIDFLIVIESEISKDVMRALVEVLLDLSKDGPKKGFEMSVILESNCRRFKYPTPFQLHYSDYHKVRYENNLDYFCSNSVDYDLAAHIAVLCERGRCISGKPIEQVFEKVPRKYYIDSIIKDISNVKEEVFDNPIYYVLNLCRVLYYLKEGIISSKQEGGEWGYLNCPNKYRNIIQGALNSHNDVSIELNIQQELLIEFVDFIQNEIDSIRSAID